MIKLMIKTYEKLKQPILMLKNNNLFFINTAFEKLFNIDFHSIKNNFNKETYLSNKDYSIDEINEEYNNNYYTVYIFNNNFDYISSNSSTILKTIIDNVPEIIFFKDKEGVYKVANKHCLDFYSSKGAFNVIGKKDSDLPLNNDFLKTCISNDNYILNNKKALYFEESITLENDDIQIFETIKTPVLDNNNNLLGIVGVAKDITEYKQTENILRKQSYTDVLTGLYNRAYFDIKIKNLIDNKNFPIGLIVGDVNGLKLINDTLGHLEGDNLIISVSNALNDICIDSELIFRWGGDEFIILTPNCSNKRIEYLTNTLNNLSSLYTTNSDYKISMSVGSSIILNESDKVDEILKDAENKLYRQKLLVGKSVRSSILYSLTESLQTKNLESKDHTERVVTLSLEVGKILNLNSSKLDELSLLAKLHDIGKIGIPEQILLKPSSLTKEEFEIMKTHCEKGYRLTVMIPELSHIARGILTHHEHYDGSGYPLGLSGDYIPLISRIISIVDAYDAMTNNRVYNKAKVPSEAISELKRCSGKQFDPKIVNIFCSIIKEKGQ